MRGHIWKKRAELRWYKRCSRDEMDAMEDTMKTIANELKSVKEDMKSMKIMRAEFSTWLMRFINKMLKCLMCWMVPRFPSKQ